MSPFVTSNSTFSLTLFIACPPENFKPSRSNTEICRPCPKFSSSPGNQAVCMCDAGHYRAQSESISDDCTGEGNLLFASFLTLRGFMVVTSLPTHTNTAQPCTHIHH